ncbi:DNA-3-methyladenine glycosylase I [Formosimonas limnophila]|uniref:DNA-3-methyladenine glycosylase I n=1 Tax=Formosimonas limnophila TaxID=1384487 RepID=A0A8J3G0M6_9BURK|nr:DNA-3-methyladenine glycosylase I [Formosimonas limnophila]GHA76507.1 DNA-3-methyladenine glycosylase I [Formosimonas limnophila]
MAAKTTENLINNRCFWCGEDELYVHYHDQEWGKPMHDDVRLFEKICLEGFQSGLSWYTILKRRETFRRAFKGFDFKKVAKFTEADVVRLLQDEGIIRHRGKIEATINNAQRALEIVKEFGSLDTYFWQFVSPADERPKTVTRASIPASTPTSIRLSKDLKKRGWKFVGPTTCYAFMQAMGLVNDHMDGCHFR